MNVRRPVILFLSSTIVGIIIAYSEAPALFKLLIIAIAIFLYLKLFFEGKVNKLALIVIFLFFILGFYRFKYEKYVYDRYTDVVSELKKGDKVFTGKLESIGKSTNSNYYIISSCDIDGKKLGTCRCYFKDEIKVDAKLGNYIKVKGSAFTIDSPLNEGEFNQKNYYRSDGICFLSYAKEITIVNNDYYKIRQGIYDIKCIINEQIKKILNEKDAGLFTAMITGDKSNIDREQKRLFSDNGIAHILAISGLHLSILGLCLFELLRKKFSIHISAGFVSLFILFYGIFIDAGATSLRAITMLYIRFLSLSIGRTYDSKNALYIICFIFLMLRPYLLFSAGFQFSYVAIFSLNEEVVIKTKKKDIKVPSVITLTFFLLPITIYHYFTYPLYSILLNLIVIPLMSFVLGFGLIGLAISFLFLPLGRIFALVVHIIFLIYDKLCYLVEKLPFHILWLGKPNLYEILFYYVALFLIIYALAYKTKNTDDTYTDNSYLDKLYEKISSINVRPVLCIILLFMSVGIMAIRVKPGFKMTFISIGQGDAILVQAYDTIITIDGGSSSNTSAGQYTMTPHIKSRAIDHIDYAFVSHSDSDHTNALMYLMDDENELRIRNLVLPLNAKSDVSFDKLKDSATFKGTKIIYMGEGSEMSLANDLSIEVLSPSEKNIKKKLDENELSLTFKLDYKGFTTLFTGDIGAKTIDMLLKNKNTKDRLKSDILKIPHHGSKGSLNNDFYTAVSPKYAIISYGKNNSYGHPHKVVVDTLENQDINVLKTAEKGQIDIYFNENEITYKTFR